MSSHHRHGRRVQIWTGRRVRFVLAAMLICQTHACAQSRPQPPCGTEPVSPYPGADDPAIPKSWKKSELGRDWKPLAFTGWTALGFTTLVTTAARFRYTSEAEGLLHQFEAMSTRWRAVLVYHAQAMANTNCRCARSDGVAAESAP